MKPIRCLIIALALCVACKSTVGTPRFQYVASHACAEVVAYAWSEPRTEYVVVYADLLRLGIGPGSTRTFQIASASHDLAVQVDVYPKAALDLYCSDVKVDEKSIAWRAISGTVTISRSANPKTEPQVSPSDYRVVVTVADLVVEGPRGQRVRAVVPITLTGQAGGNPFG